MNHHSSRPTVTTIIPAYNAESCVATAIESALTQTVPPAEILVVDDGSRDGTREVVSSYGGPVRLIAQANAGPGAARNRAAREARGEWLAFLDADDSWLPDKLARQLPFGDDPRVGLIHSRDKSHWSLRPGVNLDFDVVWRRNPIVLSSAVVRRSAFEEVGGFSEQRSLDPVADYNLWLRLLAAGWQIGTCPEALYMYTPAAGNLSSQTERFAKAELDNLDALAAALELDLRRVREKRIAILTEYGRELLFFRKMKPARAFFAQVLSMNPSPDTLVWWCATFVPRGVLNYLRKAPAPQLKSSQA